MLGKQDLSGAERLGKALDTVAATVDQFAGPLEVLLQQGFFDRSLLIIQENAQ